MVPHARVSSIRRAEAHLHQKCGQKRGQACGHAWPRCTCHHIPVVAAKWSRQGLLLHCHLHMRVSCGDCSVGTPEL